MLWETSAAEGPVYFTLVPVRQNMFWFKTWLAPFTLIVCSR